MAAPTNTVRELQTSLFASTAETDAVLPSGEDKQVQLGQYLTPAHVARFLASLFENQTSTSTACILDAGAGRGALTEAVLDRLDSTDVRAIAVEVDPDMHAHLSASRWADRIDVQKTDFVSWALNTIQSSDLRFTHAILNPPYKKIRGNSRHKRLLTDAGVPAPNLYASFVALALRLLQPGGELVAIIPRSFCNGRYYRSFRRDLLALGAISHLHLFDSRTATFKGDGVLQENMVVKLVAGVSQGDVTVSHSTDDALADYTEETLPFERIVPDPAGEGFIHIPSLGQGDELGTLGRVTCSLRDLGITASTGPVVDFRLREHLAHVPTDTTVPLIYPGHFTSGEVVWPRPNYKKPDAIERNADTERWLYDAGTYCVVRRFSSKEEARRVVSCSLDTRTFSDASRVGFENHINVFHDRKRGLPSALADGLALYLGSRAVDERFRRFSGHTQVNVTDLKQLPYPDRNALTDLSKLDRRASDVDEQIANVLR